MTKKNAIHIVIKSPSGGVWNTARETASVWARAGYDVHLASALVHETPNIENVKTSSILKSKPSGRFTKLWSSVCGIIVFLRREKPSHVVVYSLPLSVIFALLKTFFGYRLTVVTDMHASSHLQYGRALNKERSFVFKCVSKITHNPFFYRFVMKCANNVVAHNNHMIDDLIDNFGLDKKKSHSIPAFIERSFFETVLPVKRKNKTILYVGRMTDQKNIEDLISAFEILSKNNPEIILKIAGDGPLENKYKAMTRNPNIQFLGVRSDIMALQADANCVVLCSHYEGVSLVMMEAVAGGVPIVSYDHLSGPIEFIKNGKNGFLTPAYDVDALANTMDKSLNYNWNPAHIRESARDFHLDNVKIQYLSMLRDMQS
jgi:glycosyltransferase involved in cell wall biosynthesis